MNIERVKIEELSCDPKNARAHPDKNLDVIANSLKRYKQAAQLGVALMEIPSW